eukprot:CAMPEP_0170774068 /NCGR_PEP_ID=MMETSP0733-20121128/9746_1 /TAXON_ID=186038 /ORGANISM="Fragilariopsis kerguelensis, Strain L26-C5" /LENGTH=155 /DNA_ID=CAMNT_0011116571 /DNA_START=255 /DNA_END=719 /DNA_ORIENTATION=+
MTITTKTITKKEQQHALCVRQLQLLLFISYSLSSIFLLSSSRQFILISVDAFVIGSIPARTIKGSQPPIRVLHGKFRPTGLPMPVRSARPTTAVYASTGTGTDDISSMRAGEMKKELESYGISTVSFVEKSELVKALEKARAEGLTPESPSTSKT